MIVAHRRPAGSVVTRARRGEQGAVLFLVALCSTVLIVSVAFTVDLGRVSTTRRDLQKSADAVALDLSRRLDGSTRSQLVTAGTVAAAYERSMTRNGLDPADGTWDVGTWDPMTETWTSAAATTVPTAARVRIDARVDYAFMPGGQSTSRVGIAGQRTAADVCLASFSARVRTDDSPVLRGLLGGVLGTELDLAGYRGIAGGTVDVQALATHLGTSVGTPTELSNTEVTLARFIEAEADALADRGDLVRAQLLRQTILGLPNPAQLIRLGDVLAVGNGGPEAALLATLDAFDLLAAGAMVANGSNAITIPGLSLGVPGLADVTVRATVVEKPRCLIAGTVGDGLATAVVRLELVNHLGVVGAVDVSLSTSVQAAAASARITRIDCGSPRRLGLDITTSAVQSQIRFDLLVDVGLLRVGVPVTGSTNNGATVRIFDRLFPQSVFGQTYQVPTPGLNLGAVHLTVGGDLALVGALVNPLVTNTLGPALAALDTVIMTPLLQALGVTVAGADVTPRAVHCLGPRLVG